MKVVKILHEKIVGTLLNPAFLEFIPSEAIGDYPKAVARKIKKTNRWKEKSIVITGTPEKFEVERKEQER